ncbi:Type-1 cystatin cysteine protease inhibitor [Fasciola hepatica]|uniref:Type-1 cystatin cysteine protease inhibitor n=1 Tax=Fasciola hepatica TaxID=6192 RepID=A0A2H1BUS1_FASHE|nr:Type-1 cystatin cysteine protease inhibitor [Fasciola hepatica]
MLRILLGICILHFMSCDVFGEMLVGGYTEPRSVTPEERSVFQPMILSKLLTTGSVESSCELELLQVSTQVVAGTNYKFKVSGGATCPGCWEVVVFVPLYSSKSATSVGTPTRVSCT